MDKVELERIHRELDGENSPEESRRLHAFIAENLEARRLYDELSSVDQSLRHANMIEPPAWLKARVMEALPTKRRSEGFSLSAYLRDLMAPMQARPVLAYAYTFAIGILFGLGLFAVALQDTPGNEADLYGALVENTSDADVLPIQHPEFRARADVFTSGRFIIVDLIIEAEEKVDVRLSSEPPQTLNGFTRKAENAGTTIDVDDEAIMLGIQGSDRWAVMFNVAESSDPEVRMEVRQEGRLIYEEQLRIQNR